MITSARVWFGGWVVGLLLLPAGLAGQVGGAPEGGSTPKGGWAFGASGSVAHWGKESDPFDWVGGPALEAAWVPSRALGFDVRAGYVVPTGRYVMEGVWANLAATYGIPVGGHLLQLEGGAAGFLAGDSDGSQWIAGGPLVGAGALVRLGSRVGLRVGGFTQVLAVSGEVVASPGARAGLVLLR